ncbi:MFS transporter [Clostridium faecium]|uniref:MFS transporter n=1 Tax=Clostridium faecium TaxID=2762223 RepID=A0ABR8YPY2_9CLOT|nr:MFS transporter [Clostridium faecium]MBD8046266.1 MFS transporter [Clostridium faecium]MDU1350739.1 MFS transporter [Clostridium argentinense]
MRENSSKSFSENYWKTIVFTFCLGWTIIWIYRAMLSPIYSEIQGTIGQQTNAAMGLIASCYFFGYTSMQIPSGFLVDKFGQKKVLIPGFIIFTLGAISIALSKTIGTIYMGSVLAGIGCGTYYGAAFSLTAQHVPPSKKGIATAIVNSGSALGFIIGMTGSSYVVKTLNMPWQTMVYISAALIFFMVLWFFFMIKNTSTVTVKKDNQVKADTVKEIDSSEKKSSLFSLNMFSCYILYFCTCYAYYLIVTWLPKFLETERGITGGLIGLIVSMISVTAVPGALFFAHLSDKKRDKKSYIIIGLEVAAFVLVAVSMMAPNTSSLAIILLLYGFLGKMAVDPVLISYVSDKADKKNLATTLGTFNFFGMSSSIVAPAATGIIMDKTGSGVLGFYIGAFLLIFGVMFFAVCNAKNFKNAKHTA